MVKFFRKQYIRFMVWLGAAPPPGFNYLIRDEVNPDILNKQSRSQTSENKWEARKIVLIFIISVIIGVIGVIADLLGITSFFRSSTQTITQIFNEINQFMTISQITPISSTELPSLPLITSTPVPPTPIPPTSTPVPQPTWTPTNTPLPPPTWTPTPVPPPTWTPTPIPPPTWTPVPSPDTPTPTSTWTPTWTPTLTPTPTWTPTLIPVAFKIQNKNSGKFLAVAFSSKDAAANVIQFDDNSQEDILWKLLPLY
jgi:hypothetical protein